MVNNRTSLRPTKEKKFGLIYKLAFAFIILFVLLAGFLIFKHHNNSEKTGNSTTNTRTVASTSNNASTNNARKNATSSSSSLGSGTSNTTSSPNTTFTVQIVSANINNNNIHVGTLVSGVSSGVCTLTANQLGHATLQFGSSAVRQEVNSYDCGVFNIPISSFPSSGVWTLTLTVTGNGASEFGTEKVNI